MGGLRTRHLGAMGPRDPSLSGPLAGGLGGGGGWRAAPKWEATEKPLILGASLCHPHLGSYPAGERMGVWVSFTGRKVPPQAQFSSLLIELPFHHSHPPSVVGVPVPLQAMGRVRWGWEGGKGD